MEKIRELGNRWYRNRYWGMDNIRKNERYCYKGWYWKGVGKKGVWEIKGNEEISIRKVDWEYRNWYKDYRYCKSKEIR